VGAGIGEAGLKKGFLVGKISQGGIWQQQTEEQYRQEKREILKSHFSRSLHNTVI